MPNESYLQEGCVLREGKKSIIDGIILIVIGLFALIGNLLVFIAFLKYRTLRNVTNIFIVSVAAADIFVAVLPIPMTFAAYICNWLATLPRGPGETAEKVYLVCDILASCVSIISLTAVAVDKYIAIVWPFRHNRIITYSVALTTVVAVWICGLLFGIVNMYMDGYDYTLFIMISSYLLPVAIMMFCYINIAIIGRRQARKIGSQQMSARHYRSHVTENDDSNCPNTDKCQDVGSHTFGNNSNDSKADESAFSFSSNHTIGSAGSYRTESRTIGSIGGRHRTESRFRRKTIQVTEKVKSLRKELKAACTLSIIMGWFIVTWTPFMIGVNLRHYLHYELDYNLVMYLKFLHYLNSAVNPCLYAALNTRWRIAFKKLLCSCRKTQRDVNASDIPGW